MRREFELVQRLDVIRTICASKKVLHLGCTNYPYTQDAIDNEMLLHFELQKCAKELVGFDYDPEGLDILTKHGSTNLFRADLEKLGEIELEDTFDVILAGEMIEHLNNPGLFLDGVKRFMNPETVLILTTINAYCAMRFVIYALRGKGGANEPVHPDHVAYYSYSTLRLLLERHGFDIEKFMFYDLGTEHRPHSRKVYNFINDISVWISPQLADGVIAISKLRD
ncbi:MAG: class I SAM-dependent methyltransferase [Blastocatellia bacterium]